MSSRLARGEDRVGIVTLDSAMFELTGDVEDGMSRRNSQRKLGTTRGSPRHSRTAKASRINRRAAKSRCACEWGGWGRLSDDGPGQNNPDPSEDPWGWWLMPLHGGARSGLRPGSGRATDVTTKCTKDGCKPDAATCMSGADLSEATAGKAPSEKPAFQPYRGKPAVRNVRGDRGNVGIIRSPLRASILPDRITKVNAYTGSSPGSTGRSSTPCAIDL